MMLMDHFYPLSLFSSTAKFFLFWRIFVWQCPFLPTTFSIDTCNPLFFIFLGGSQNNKWNADECICMSFVLCAIQISEILNFWLDDWLTTGDCTKKPTLTRLVCPESNPSLCILLFLILENKRVKKNVSYISWLTGQMLYCVFLQ